MKGEGEKGWEKERAGKRWRERERTACCNYRTRLGSSGRFAGTGGLSVEAEGTYGRALPEAHDPSAGRATRCIWIRLFYTCTISATTTNPITVNYEAAIIRPSTVWSRRWETLWVASESVPSTLLPWNTSTWLRAGAQTRAVMRVRVVSEQDYASNCWSEPPADGQGLYGSE